MITLWQAELRIAKREHARAMGITWGSHGSLSLSQCKKLDNFIVIQSVRDTVRKADSIPKPNISVSDSVR